MMNFNSPSGPEDQNSQSINQGNRVHVQEAHQSEIISKMSEGTAMVDSSGIIHHEQQEKMSQNNMMQMQQRRNSKQNNQHVLNSKELVDISSSEP